MRDLLAYLEERAGIYAHALEVHNAQTEAGAAGLSTRAHGFALGMHVAYSSAAARARDAVDDRHRTRVLRRGRPE